MKETISIGTMNRDFIIGAFRSRQQVLLFIKELNAHGAKARVMNTPHEIKIGCGLSAAFDYEDFERAKQIVRQNKPPSFVGFYYAEPDGVRLKISPAMLFIH